MDRLSLFGLGAVSPMLVAYALQARGQGSAPLFAGACGSATGLVQGVWPFGLVEPAWAAVALAERRARVAA